MKVMYGLFAIVTVLSLLIIAFIAAEGRKSESCQCYFVTPITGCEFDERGVGYRYKFCGGSCAAYGGWAVDFRCVPPKETRTLPASIP